MKIAYGTYAMPMVRLEDALPGLAAVGYDGVEICIGPKHVEPTDDSLPLARRKALRGMLAKHSLGLPALFVLGHVYTESEKDHQANLERMRRCAQLARDLEMPGTPVLAIGFGGPKPQWDEIRHRFVELLADYAEVADEEDFILAGEAHAGAAVDRSERIVWLLEELDNPRVRLHFDIVHLFLAGETEAEAVRTLVPYTAHTHITDAIKRPDGGFELVLLGKGQLDATAYMAAMAEAGWDSYSTLEVSTMVWAKEGYNPWQTARFSYESLCKAFEGAGVSRG